MQHIALCVETLKKFLRSKIGDVPTFVEIIMWDDGDFEIAVRHTAYEDLTQHILRYHDSSKRVDMYTVLVADNYHPAPRHRSTIPVSYEEIFK